MKLSKEEVTKRILEISNMNKDEVIKCFYSLHVEELDFKAEKFMSKAINMRVMELMDSRNYI